MEKKVKNNIKEKFNSKHTLKWLYVNAAKYTPFTAMLAVLGAVSSFIGVRFAYASKNLLDVATKSASGTLSQSMFFLCALIAAQLVVHIVYTMFALKVQYSVKYSVQADLFKKMLLKRITELSKTHTGELMNRLNSDVQIITNGIVTIIPGIVTYVSQILFSLYALYKMDKSFALICVVLGPVVMIITRIYSKKMKKLHKLNQLADGKIRSFMLECLQNILALKAFVCENAATLHAKELQRQSYKIAFKRNVVSVAANILFFVAMTASYYFALAWCAYKISVGLMTVGTLAAVLQLVGKLQTPFSDLSSLIPQYFSMSASVERISEIEQIADDKCVNTPEQAQNMRDSFKKIEIKNISFSYDNDLVFNNASAVINKGETVAISGISGIGKSTLFKLMLGVVPPNSGSIEIGDGTVSLKSDKSTRIIFTYVPQGNLILSGTIRDNIVFFSGIPNDGRLKECAQIADIYDVIMSLPDKFDTVLGEKGTGLSEGQIQRLAIARALYNDAPVILLDEATSALDEQTEQRVISNIKQLKNKTCILISHKPGAVKMCDKQLAVKDKKIICER